METGNPAQVAGPVNGFISPVKAPEDQRDNKHPRYQENSHQRAAAQDVNHNQC